MAHNRCFLDRIHTPAQDRAIDAMLALPDWESKDRVLAQASYEDRMAIWERDWKLSKNPCSSRVIGKNCKSHKGNCDMCRPPGCDHPKLWVHKTSGERLFTFEPYIMDIEEIAALVKFCEINGMNASITAEYSVHFPARTFMVRLRKAASGQHLDD